MHKLTQEFLDDIHNLMHPRWKPGLNLFSGILFDELAKLAGYIPHPEHLSLPERREIARTNLEKHKSKEDTPEEWKGKETPYPEAHNWLDREGKNYITPVKNQEFCNACTAFGAIAAAETMIRIREESPEGSSGWKALPELSEGQLFFGSPGFSRERKEGAHNCLTGWNLNGVLTFLEEEGVVPEKLYPYDDRGKAPNLPEGWQKTTTAIDGNVTLENHFQMKKWLREKGPLISAVEFHPDFLFYSEGVYEPILGEPLGGHCVCVIGYDDRKEAWLCKNSWGTHWGEEGFFWIGYGECGIDSQMIGITGFKRIYKES